MSQEWKSTQYASWEFELGLANGKLHSLPVLFHHHLSLCSSFYAWGKERSSFLCLCYSSRKLVCSPSPSLAFCLFHLPVQEDEIRKQPLFQQWHYIGFASSHFCLLEIDSFFLSVNLSKDLLKIRRVIFQSGKVLMKWKNRHHHATFPKMQEIV